MCVTNTLVVSLLGAHQVCLASRGRFSTDGDLGAVILGRSRGQTFGQARGSNSTDASVCILDLLKDWRGSGKCFCGRTVPHAGSRDCIRVSRLGRLEHLSVDWLCSSAHLIIDARLGSFVVRLSLSASFLIPGSSGNGQTLGSVRGLSSNRGGSGAG